MNEGRVAIVTGAGSGMGRAIAHRLAADGFAVAILDLDAGAAEVVADEIRSLGLRAGASGRVDISVRAQVDGAVGEVT